MKTYGSAHNYKTRQAGTSFFFFNPFSVRIWIQFGVCFIVLLGSGSLSVWVFLFSGLFVLFYLFVLTSCFTLKFCLCPVLFSFTSLHLSAPWAQWFLFTSPPSVLMCFFIVVHFLIVNKGFVKILKILLLLRPPCVATSVLPGNGLVVTETWESKLLQGASSRLVLQITDKWLPVY